MRDRDAPLYHGTNTLARARSILEHGIRPDMPSVYRHGYEPRPGHVYMTGEVATAAKYACWPVKGGWSGAERDYPDHPHGFVFVVPSPALSVPLQPDEDDVGEFMASHAGDIGMLAGRVTVDGETVTIRDYAFRAIPGEPDTGPKRRAWLAMRKMLTPAIMTRLEFDDGAGHAGKLILDRIPQRTMDSLVRWGNGNVSHAGPVEPAECWRFAKADAGPLRSGKASLEEVAERVHAVDLGCRTRPVAAAA